MKNFLSIIIVFCMVFLVGATISEASYIEIGVPAVREPIEITVKLSDGQLWEPGDSLDDIWITVEPYGGSVVEIYYDDDACIFVVYFNPDLIYFEPCPDAYVNGHEGTVKEVNQDTYEIRILTGEGSEPSENQLEPIFLKILQAFLQLFKNFFYFINK